MIIVFTVLFSGKSFAQNPSYFEGLIVNAPSNADALLKLKVANEQSNWGLFLGQSTGLNGYLSTPGRDFAISVGWDKSLILGSEPMSSYGGKVLVPGGNVGIGTNSPLAKVHIFNQNQDSGGNTLILGPTNQSNLRLGYHQNYSWIQSHGGKPLVINAFGNNVAIGTSTPDANSKLTVKGIIHAEEIKVDLNVPGPDYVFAPDYPLISLEETKAYIEQNKHLPGMPSSNDMQQNGVNLLEMNMKLLEKVEELTLYLIEQKELHANLESTLLQKIEALEKKLNDLK